LSSLANYFHTLRYLQPVQLFGRIRFKLYRPRPDRRPAPPPRVASAPFAAPICGPQSVFAEDRFRFLNLEGVCSSAAHWRDSGRTQLWTYNLHYFDDLNAVDASARRRWHERLVQRWIDENPPTEGNGWNPYPVSRRVVNWIKWSQAGNSLTQQARQSLAVQVRWLNRRIESHLQGNHVSANAKALIFAGLYFAGEEGDGWLRKGLGLMQKEIRKQVLADGGHFERSPMYHAGFMEDLLDTVGAMRAYDRAADSTWHAIVTRMMAWLEAMSHPDQRIAFFNDAAFGVSPEIFQLRAYAARLGLDIPLPAQQSMRRLMPSGYISLDLPPFYLVCDVAPVGPDHLPAHAHADTLSFELSFGGRRVFVNSGTSEYGAGAERHRQRGTAAHNTLVIDGQDSSEVWAGFRVARRARARLLEARSTDATATVVAEHNGYRRLRGRNTHKRSWRLTAQTMHIEDVVGGGFRSAQCFFYLHPEIRVTRIGESELQLGDSQRVLLQLRFEGADRVEIIESTWHPEFGLAVPSNCIVATLGGPRLTTLIRVSDPA
jgi:uncharacterized heparinase superfamily protein